MKLEAIDISFKYGKGSRQILDHVNLSVELGEKVGIMAPSGYGKTTLCKLQIDCSLFVRILVRCIKA